MTEIRHQLTNIAGVALVIVIAALIFALGLLPVLWWGFAWGLIVSVVIGSLIGRLSGGGIDGGWAAIIAWIILAAGFVIGCGWRYLPMLWGLFS